MTKWKCKICGYIYEGETQPEDYTCPIWKQPASSFEKVEEVPSASGTSPYAGTKTEKNLQEAFAGESQARNKYTFFAQIAELFLMTARNEQEHARLWYQELGHVGTSDPVGANRVPPAHSTAKWTCKHVRLARCPRE